MVERGREGEREREGGREREREKERERECVCVCVWLRGNEPWSFHTASPPYYRWLQKCKNYPSRLGAF
jgi:hypothetical protein